MIGGCRITITDSEMDKPKEAKNDCQNGERRERERA
jgi:hypothetical protein